MTDTQGFRAAPTLDGLHLVGISPDAVEIADPEIKGNLTMADGAVRELRPRFAELGPEVRRHYSFTIDYRNLGGYSAAVEARLAFAGAHDFALWKHVTLGYRADGAAAEWELPDGWRLALDVSNPPPGQPAARFEPEVKVGFDGATLTVRHKATEDYEADIPAAGEVWFETGGRRFKLSVPPLAGARVVAHVVPMFRVVTGAESQARRYTEPVREPRRLVLEEAVA